MALTDKLTAIAEAIRAKTGETGTMTPAEMPGKIASIETGGGSGATDAIVVTERDANGNAVTVDMSGFQGDVWKYQFYGDSWLEEVIMPTQCKSVGNNAFYMCKNLETVHMPSGVKRLDNSAFLNCSKLQMNSLPESITTIGTYVFSGCSALALTNLPEGIETIPQNAFHNCSSLALTHLPPNLQKIDAVAFGGASTSYTKPNMNLREIAVSGDIGKQAFAYNTGLKTLKIKCARLGTASNAAAAFQNCTGLTHVWLSSEIGQIYASSYSYAPFYNCGQNVVLYTDAASKPNVWGSYFNYYASGKTLTVNYGVTEEQFEEIVNTAYGETIYPQA